MALRSDSRTSITSYRPPALCFDAYAVGQWVCERAGGTWVPGRGTAIGQIQDGRFNAGVLYEDYNGANVFCHIAGEGNWANRRFLGVIYDYPFNQLKVKRITVPVADDNERCIALVKHMGFSLESRLEQANPRGGDILLFRMFRNECKYLEDRYAKHVF